MITDEVHILPTNKTPEFLFKPEGFIKIKGRAIDESRAGVPEQIVKWIDAYLLDPAESTEVIIALEFLNSFNTIILTSNLRKISRVLQQGKKLVVRWYYDEDDVDLFERGEYIAATLNIPIEFIMTNNLADC
jgi:SiaC family regulatory phosphoprotein